MSCLEYCKSLILSSVYFAVGIIVGFVVAIMMVRSYYIETLGTAVALASTVNSVENAPACKAVLEGQKIVWYCNESYEVDNTKLYEVRPFG